MTTERDPRSHYREAREAASRDSKDLSARMLWTSRFRAGSFIVVAGALLLLETTPRDLWPFLLVLAGVAAVVFVMLVRVHGRLRRLLNRSRLREKLNREGEARLDREWNALPPPPLERAPEHHPSAADLDLVGHASLAHLIGRVNTAPGRAILQQVLLNPLAPMPTDAVSLLEQAQRKGFEPAETPHPGWMAALTARQRAIRTLAASPEFRTELELRGREVPGHGVSQDTLGFLLWAGGPGMLTEDRRLLYLARVLGVFTPLTLVGMLLGWVPGIFPLVGGVAALALHRKATPSIHSRFAAAEAGEGDLARWSGLLRHIETLPGGDPLLDQLREQVLSPEPGAARALRQLMRLTDTAGIRRSSLAHFPLVALFCIDVHILDLLEGWQRRNGEAVGGWIRALGEMETLTAMAGLVHDHPSWTFPVLTPKSNEGLRAHQLGHPLLHPDRCISNDVEVPAPGRLLVVTGSNMAGKTTLLRAIGTNQVLALAGAPVCALEYAAPAILPWTTMRVRDSLADGVSYFLAELQRLRRVVEAARRGPVLYLLDEILQGTNSAERRTAARIVLNHLLATGSIGGITTHDLTLADTEQLQARSVHVHFREEVVEREGRRVLTFDYRLRPGTATSRNALLLLDMVGLGPEGPAGPGP